MKSSLVIRFTNTVGNAPEPRDLEIPLSVNFDKDDINKLVNTTWLKVIIRNKVKTSERKRLRLIYNGRVLNQTTNFQKDVFEPKLRQMKAAQESEDGAGQSGGGDEEMRIYIHCVIGEELSPSQLNEENQLDNRPQEVSTTPQIIGFDRLLQQGFTQEDISDLRRQFHSIYMPDLFSSSNGGSGGLEAIDDVEEEERRQRLIRQLEERWIESTINNNATNDTDTARRPGGRSGASGETEADDDDNATTNTGLTGVGEQQQLLGGGAGGATGGGATASMDDTHGNEDLLLGLGLGIFLGLVSLIFILVDDTVLNKRQKMAVFAGLFINFSFAIVRGQWL